MNVPKQLLLTLAILFPGFAVNSTTLAQDPSSEWTQWRGPARNGVFEGARLPEKLDASSLKQSWRMELGPSYSGPIVTTDLVFVTETKNKKTEVVTALDRKTGKQVWQSEWVGAMKVPFFARDNGSWIRSTPVYSDGRLYVGGIKDVMVCLDAKDGSEIWKIDFPKETGSGEPSFGFASSPLIHGDSLIVQAGGALYKLNKANGAIVWKSLDDGGGMNGAAFSSPTIATINSVEQLLVQTRTTLNGVDIESGAVLWSQNVPCYRGMNILTPLVFNDTIFTSSYRNFSFCYEPVKSENGWSVATKWQTKKPAYMSTPVEKDGHVYMHLQNQRFTCIDLASGETRWTSPPFGKYSSLIVQEDKVLALDQRGELILFKATPEKFDLLSQHSISDQETWAHIAASNNQLFIRELNAITAFEYDSE